MTATWRALSALTIRLVSLPEPIVHQFGLGPNSQQLYLNGKPLPEVDSATHLGILQGCSKTLNSDRTKDHMSRASRTLYALFGAGLHGRNGINPAISKCIWQTYVVPRLIHGTELWAIGKKDLQALAGFPPGLSFYPAERARLG